MRRPWFLFPLALLLPTSLAARQIDGTDAADNAARDATPALFAPSPEPLFRLGLRVLDPIFEIGFDAAAPGATWNGNGFRATPRAADFASANRTLFAGASFASRPFFSLEAVQTPSLAAVPSLPNATLPGATTSPETYATEDDPPPPGDEPESRPELLPSSIADFADIGMVVTGRGELGGSWTRFTPCDPGAFLNCSPGVVPQLEPDIQFGVRVGGSISDRIFVNVDYDQRREFDAANNINVYYQGRENEFLQRLEVGDVSISLPTSRYLTQGIPAGNFGFKATGGAGPMNFQAVWAQQKGDVTTREFRLGGAAGREGFVQDASIILEDADYVKGQFFFLVDPDSIAGAPHVDILALRPDDVPPSLRPAVGANIQVFRNDQPSMLDPETMAQLGYFHADAVPPGGGQPHSRQYRRLTAGEDYLVHSSGLWIVLRSPLRPDEALAVAYETAAGTVVGTLNPELAAGTTPELLLLRGPISTHEPGRPTWRYEMHQVYRLDSSNGVDISSIELDISLGPLSTGSNFKDWFGETVTYLKLFGLDEEAPADRLDRVRVYQPARTVFGDIDESAPIGGTYIVFPTLEPFARPPAVPSIGMSAEEAAALLGGDANPAIYDHPNPTVRSASARFRLTATYRIRLDGLVSSFQLGAFGIREDSERILVDGRRLERGVDYDIDYDIGIVTLLNPQEIYGANPDAEIRATWEQKALFELAPTSVFGLSTHYRLGDRGALNFVGLYQGERSLMNRPQLGLEPASAFVGGASGNLSFGAGWLDRGLAGLPFLRSSGTSAINLSGEIAMSLPNPNTRGDTYLDDFEAADEIGISMERHFWRLGSRPESDDGATGVFPVSTDVLTAAPIVWQHDFLYNGGVVGSRVPADIDRQINTAGAPRREQILWITFGDEAGVQRRWRSLTTVLSTTGRDLTRGEFLEFYASSDDAADLALVFDIGVVAEDAFYFDADGLLTGTYPGGKPWGLGILDEEASLAAGEIWSHALDSLGLWNQDCRATANPQQTYPLGDPRANCTRGNGRPDTEDLNGNGILDPEGAYFRYVVPLSAMSEYLVRDTTGTGTDFRLYRIPLRGAGAIAVNGASEGTWRYVQHLRVTITGQPSAPTVLGLARMRIVGSRWTKRAEHGILDGATGDDPGLAAGTRFHVGPVSRVTDGGAYSSPPGIRDQLQDPSAQFTGFGVEVNEKGLKLQYEQLEAGQRAEVYYRYPQQPRGFLDYRELRLWAVARAGDWGPAGTQRLMVKLGTDARNYYLYQTRLRPPPPDGRIDPADWMPELVIDFERWFDLKTRAIQALHESPGQPVVVWSEDSTYAVVMDDRYRAPDLAAVREISFAVYNDGVGPADGEVWLNDMRLRAPMTDPGFAGHITLDARAGDVLSASISYANQGGLFRQLNQEPTYLGTGDFQVNASAQLASFLPGSLGLDLPLTVAYSTTGQNPIFLQGSDVRADRLPGLRSTGGGSTRVGLTIRRRAPAANPWFGWLLDGSMVRLGYSTRNSRNTTSTSDGRNFDGSYTFGYNPAARDVPLVPGFLEAALRRLLPAAIEESEAFGRAMDARLRWSPGNVSFGTTYYRQEFESRRFEEIIRTPGDALVQPRRSPRQGLGSQARLSLQPLASLSASVLVTSSRDLLPPERTEQPERQREAIRNARSTWGGVDVGWETERNVTTTLDYRPEITSWLQPSLTYSARYRGDRHPGYIEMVPLDAGEDSLAILQRNFQATRQLTRGLRVDPRGLIAAVFGPPSAQAGWTRRTAHRLADAISRIDMNWTSALTSRFHRELGNPGVGYQLGLGGTDGFRFVDGDTAVSVTETGRFTARTAFRLPVGSLLDVGYNRSDAQSADLLGGERDRTDRTWPDLALTIAELPVPRSLGNLVRRASFRAGYMRTLRDAQIGGGTRTNGRETSVPLTFSVGFVGGLSASYNATLRDGFRNDPTGQVDSRNRVQTFSLSGSLNPPAVLQDYFQNPLTITGRVSTSHRLECRVGLQAGGACVPVIDDRSRNLDLSVDTLVEDLVVGFRTSYASRSSAIGLRNGWSTFEVALFASFNFTAGTLPGGF